MAQGEILFLPVTEEYYQLTGYLHSLFEEGLINPEVFSQDYSQFQQKSKNPAAMTVGATLGWSIEDRVGPDYADSYQVLLPLRASEETEPFWPSHPARCKYETNRVVVTANNPYPEETMRWINEMYGEEFSVQAIYGSFGIGVEKRRMAMRYCLHREVRRRMSGSGLTPWEATPYVLHQTSLTAV